MNMEQKISAKKRCRKVESIYGASFCSVYHGPKVWLLFFCSL